MALYFRFWNLLRSLRYWAIFLGLIFIGSLELVDSDYLVATGFLGVTFIIGRSIQRGVHRWSWVFALIGIGFLITCLGNALSYIRENGEVVDNLLMPYGAITIAIGILFGVYLTLIVVVYRFYAWICRVRG
ncbi:MAG: hypothetical protein V4534_04910 [Myxococcota bacterium]